MPRRKARRKGVSKTWYQVYAVDMFPDQWIGETPASDPEKLLNRNVEVSVRDITGDFMHEKYKLWFHIFKVDGNKAYARFIKEMLNRDYMRSIIQRRSSRVDIQTDSITGEGSEVRVFTLIVTVTRIKSSQKHAIRAKVDEYLKEVIPKHTVEDLIKSYIFKEPILILSEIQKAASKVAPVKYVELRKMLLLKQSETPVEMKTTEVQEQIESSASGGR